MMVTFKNSLTDEEKKKKITKKQPLISPEPRVQYSGSGVQIPKRNFSSLLWAPASRPPSNASKSRETTPALRPQPLVAPLSHARARL